jgi:hypothetical protein
MSELPAGPGTEPDATTILKQNAERLEREIAEIRLESDARLVRAELKAEAIRSGMIDLDGLKLMDTTSLLIEKDGTVVGAASLMEQFRKAKPWLFGSNFSSNTATPPPAQAPRSKLATEMSDAEYKVARAAIMKQRV